MPSSIRDWAELYERLPPDLKRYQLEMAWSCDKLWALDLPAEEVRVDELAWQLSLPWWRDGDRYFAIRPSDILKAPERYGDQFRRTLAADMGKPIHITLRHGRWFVLDGVHRLLKAVLVGAETVRAHKLSPEQLAQIAL
jgi:hypothetical protein